MIGRGVIFAHRSIIKAAEKYLCRYVLSFVTMYITDIISALTAPQNILSKTNRAPRVFDKSKALVITEKSCYIACVNACYEDPPLDPSRPDLSRLDCIAAGRHLPCSLCLARQGRTITFPPSPSPTGSHSLPILTPLGDASLQKLPIQKKDKLKKTERIRAEKHFLEIGASICELERNSNNHNLYLPRSSYFQSRIISSILDQLLVIHFPAQLEDIVKNSWMHYPNHSTALFNSVIATQTAIVTQRSSKKSKQRDRRRMNLPEDESDSRPPLPDPASSAVEAVNQASSRKRVAIEDITNTAKRRRAPRASQPTVAQAFEDFGPKYRTRRRGIVAEGSSGAGGKENES